MPDVPFSLKLYRWILRLYPTGFREDYAEPMETEFRDELAECRGVYARVGFWVRLLVDLGESIPAQISHEVSQDFKHALRLWARRPWHTGFAIAALAIGIGANTGVFSVVNGLLLRSLPFHEPSRLALLRQFIPPHDSAKQFHAWRKESTYLTDAALFEELDVNLSGARVGTRVHLAQTSWNFFPMLGTRPILGRSFTANGDVDATGWGLPGPNAEAVIGYGLWQDLFGGDPKVLGATIRANGTPLTVVGVAPPEFDFPNKAALWKPAAFSPGNNGWGAVARIKSNLSWPQARAAFRLETESTSAKNGGFDNLQPSMTSLQDGLAGPLKNASVMFMGAVVVILLIACTDVASLLLARTADRAGEFSIRSALGASRARLLRQLLSECLLLSIVASVAGLVLAYFIISLASKVAPAPLGAQSYSLLDGRVLAFTVLVSLVTAWVIGAFPALYVSHFHSVRSQGSRSTRGLRVVRQCLIGGQIMLTMILLASSICLGRAFLGLMRSDRGYDVQGVATVGVSLEGTRLELNKRQLPYFEEALGRIRRLPGVRSASATEFLPLYASAFVGGPFGVDGRPAAHGSSMIPVLSGYFETMGGRILYGREFSETEVRATARVAVVNERFAAGFGAPQNALGHQLTISGDAPWKIIGVVKGMEYETDPTTAKGNQVFVPSSTPGGFSSTFVVRVVNGRAEDHLAAIRDTIASVDPQVPVFSVRTMEQRLDEIFASPRFYRTAVWAFATVALLLAIIGIYGMVSYGVVERTQEIGIRMLLGKTPGQLRRMLLRHGLITVTAGALSGILGAHFSGRFLESLVDGAKPIGPGASATLLLFFALVASVSIWSATRRISRFDISSILRSE